MHELKLLGVTILISALLTSGVIFFVGGWSDQEAPEEECYVTNIVIATPQGVQAFMDGEFCGHIHGARGPSHHSKEDHYGETREREEDTNPHGGGAQLQRPP